MKTITFLVFILSTFISFSQENEFNKKHNLLWDIGVNHSSNFKPEYHSAYKTYRYDPPSETLYPGYYLHPSINFQSNLTYRFYFLKNINIVARLDFSHWNKVKTRSIDSINKYYIYPDSVIDILPYDFFGAPVYSKSKTLKFGFNISIGYRYKRIYVSSGVTLPLHEITKYYAENENKITRKNYSSNNFIEIYKYSFDYILKSRIEYLVNKKKIPLSIYVELNNAIFFGITVNTTSFKYNR